MVIEWDLKSNFRMVLFVLAECHLVSFAKSSVFILGERECVCPFISMCCWCQRVDSAE